MKTYPLALFSLMLCLLLQVSASAFYSPTTGRWLSRDPVQEQGGVNLYSFGENSPLTRTDAQGLSAEDWKWDDGKPGEHRPGDSSGGTLVTLWKSSAFVRPSLDVPGALDLITMGVGVVTYWYGNADIRKHEEVHVDTWTRLWGEFRDEAVSYETQYCNRRLADCIAKVITTTMEQSYYAYGKWHAADWDCSDYPPGQRKEERCRDKRKLEPMVARLAFQKHREIEACFQAATY